MKARLFCLFSRWNGGVPVPSNPRFQRDPDCPYTLCWDPLPRAPLLHCTSCASHTAGCRHEAAFLHPHALQHGLRVLAVNRPGVGRSSYDPGTCPVRQGGSHARPRFSLVINTARRAFLGSS